MPTASGPTLILATGNPHKVEELRAIFATIGSGNLNVIGLHDLPGHEQLREPEEPGATCEENARAKALSYAEQIAALLLDASMPSAPSSPFLILADDSGIEIDALRLPNGTPRPGVISSHYSTDGRETGVSREQRDAANNARVLRDLADIPPDRRTARFVCCMCLIGSNRSRAAQAAGPSASPTPTIPTILHETHGSMEGRVGIPPRVPSGTNGFGYDPLFLVAASPFNYTKTGAELSRQDKNALSHRGMAARAMAAFVVAWLSRAVAGGPA